MYRVFLINFNKFLYRLAQDLMYKLCNPNVLNRYTAAEALQHPWITK